MELEDAKLAGRDYDVGLLVALRQVPHMLKTFLKPSQAPESPAIKVSQISRKGTGQPKAVHGSQCGSVRQHQAQELRRHAAPPTCGHGPAGISVVCPPIC